MTEFDFIVVGGGAIGTAIAFGLSKRDQKVALIDESDVAFRAARGNFGLVWVQSKGSNYPAYASWTQRSATLWKESFNDELEDLTGVKTGLHQSGGVHICLSDEEFENRKQVMDDLVTTSNGSFSYEMEENAQLAKRIPGLGKDVAGASFSPNDGHVNSLYMLRALHTGFKHFNGQRFVGKASTINYLNPGFEVVHENYRVRANKIVIAAGLGNIDLAPKLGMKASLRPERGQVLVTERLKPLLDTPSTFLRQTDEGSLLLGDSHEDVGLNEGTRATVMRDIAQRATRTLPLLKGVRIVRAWGALRILTPDGYPTYEQSTQCPGAFSATAHSGVTLAATHANDFAEYLIDGSFPSSFDAFSEGRFHVR